MIFASWSRGPFVKSVQRRLAVLAKWILASLALLAAHPVAGRDVFGVTHSWIQPPGYVHVMVHSTWLPRAVNVGVSGFHNLSASAQVAEDGSLLRVLLVNNGTAACAATVQLKGWSAAATANVTVLTANSLTAANPPGNPTLISPMTRTVGWSASGGRRMERERGPSDGARAGATSSCRRCRS